VAREHWPWLLLELPVVLVTKNSQPDSLQGFLPTLGQRFLVAGDAITFYLGKLLWPIHLGPDYGRTPELVLSQVPRIYLVGLLPYLLAALLLWRCRTPRLWAAVGIPLAILAPVLGLLSFSFQDMSTVADRYCYLAMVGPALLVARLLERAPRRLAVTTGVAILTALAVLSMAQTRHWRDPMTFNAYTLSINPRSWMAFHNLGLWYLDHNQLDQAIAQYEQALVLKPTSFKAYNNLGMIYDRLGDKERAIAAYQQALRIKPNYPLVCNNLAVIYKGLKRYDEAIAYYQRALLLDPEFAEVYANLGNLYRQLGNPAAAADNYRRALTLRPHNAELANDLGLLHAEEEKFIEAIACYRQAVAARPQFAEAYANMGVAWACCWPRPAPGTRRCRCMGGPRPCGRTMRSLPTPWGPSIWSWVATVRPLRPCNRPWPSIPDLARPITPSPCLRCGPRSTSGRWSLPIRPRPWGLPIRTGWTPWPPFAGGEPRCGEPFPG
jgi:tetratricopeptide (TPR) repeat protein